MKVRLLILLQAVCLSCSAPRYTYDFGQPAAAAEPGPASLWVPGQTPPAGEHTFSAGLSVQVVDPVRSEIAAPAAKAVQPHREPRKLLKNPLAPAQPLAVTSEKLDPDLKRSVLFFAGGLVALLIGGDVFVVLGSLSLLIGLIFGIKWLLRE